VALPFALARKYPNAAFELAWAYVFPASRLGCDPLGGKLRRHQHDLHGPLAKWTAHHWFCCWQLMTRNTSCTSLPRSLALPCKRPLRTAIQAGANGFQGFLFSKAVDMARLALVLTEAIATLAKFMMFEGKGLKITS
jgi:hypothetical protein